MERKSILLSQGWVTSRARQRLVGQSLRVEVHESVLRLYLGRERVLELPRARGRAAVIHFRDVVGPMLRKPGAFLNYQHREQLYPSVTYRAAYDRLVHDHGQRPGVIQLCGAPHNLMIWATFSKAERRWKSCSRLAERYERGSVMISSNLVFSKWDQIFKDAMTTMAAVDRLVHHSIILEFDNDSIRAEQAKGKTSSKNPS